MNKEHTYIHLGWDFQRGLMEIGTQLALGTFENTSQSLCLVPKKSYEKKGK